MAIKSSIFQEKDEKLTALDSGKNPKTLSDKNEFEKYLHKHVYERAYADYLYGAKKGTPLDIDAWKKSEGYAGNPIEDRDMVLKYTERYFPEYLADVTEYYASFNPSTVWKPKTDTKVETVVPETGNTDSGNTSTDTSTNVSTSGKQDDVTTPMTATDSAVDSALNLIESYNGNMDATRNQIADRMWQMIESYWKENPLETDYGKAILDYYGVLGENSANAVNAATAAENSGNIDSYAAANAERQRLSRYGQAVQNIYGMSSERAKNVNDLLSNLGVNMNELYKTQGQYGVGTAADYAATLYGTDADSTNQYNALIAELEANTNPVIKIDNDAVKSKLKEVYNSLNATGGDKDIEDWSTTDKSVWEDVVNMLAKNDYYKQFTPDYLYKLISEIMQGGASNA